MLALAIVGGRNHDAAQTLPALHDLFDTVEAHTEVEAGLAALDADRHDVFVMAGLACTYGSDRYDDDVRRQWGFSLSPGGRDAIDAWVGGGHPVLALHTALVSFDDWDRWGEVLGRRWDWDTSSHPPPGPVAVTVDDGDDFTVVDEQYRDLAVTGPVTDVAHSEGHPMAWTRTAGTARVAVDTLGHDMASLAEPGHRALLDRLVDWLGGGR